MERTEEKIFMASGHLSRDGLTAYIRDDVKGRELDQLESHLSSCELCSDSLEGLTMVGFEKGGDIISGINEEIDTITGTNSTISFPSWFKPLAAAAAIMVFLMAGWLSYDLIIMPARQNRALSQETRTKASEEKGTNLDKSTNLKDQQLPATENEPGILPTKDKGLIEKENLFEREDEENLKLEYDLNEDVPPSPVVSEIIETIAEPSVDKEIGAFDELEDSYLGNAANKDQNRYDIKNITGETGNVRGRLISADDGTELSFANVVVQPGNVGVTTDFEGRYSLDLPPGSYQLDVNYIGYETFRTSVDVEEGKYVNLDIALDQSQLALDEVVIMNPKSKSRADKRTETMGVNDISSTETSTYEQQAGIFNKAMTAYNKGQYRKASKLFEDVKPGDPNYTTATYFYGSSLLNSGDADAALRKLDTYLLSNQSAYKEDAAWIKTLSLIDLERISEAKFQLQHIVKEGGKYSSNAMQKLEELK